MSMTPSELESLLTGKWENDVSEMSTAKVTEYRALKLARLDGVDMPFLFTWPKDLRRVMFKTTPPPTCQESTKLFIFFVGNGYSPVSAGTWLITYYGLCTWRKRGSLVKSRIKQLVGIYESMIKEKNTMHYWDLRNSRRRKVVDSDSKWLSVVHSSKKE